MDNASIRICTCQQLRSKHLTLCIHSMQAIGVFDTLFSCLLCTLDAIHGFVCVFRPKSTLLSIHEVTMDIWYHLDSIPTSLDLNP